jgi:hypothetical protein
MTKLHVFGDSYSTPGFCVDPQDSWWGLMAKELSEKIQGVENYSWPGNNIDSIAHIIVANSNLFAPDGYVVIGVPPIERVTVFDKDAESKKVVRFNSILAKSVKENVAGFTGVKQITTHQLSKHSVDLYDRSWQEAQVLRQLITLLAYVKNCVENVLIVNLSTPFQPMSEWPTLNRMQQQVYKEPCMLIDQNTYYSTNYQINQPLDFETHGWFGHQGPVGNQHWFRTALLPKMKELQWV